ncbi:DgyrCDS4999 [Dimorphilus gyrociliatus]|uniref:DgyrCDS4999 n=1 Tax=Dimorphilus gyrociliatus TaxID=2664684 RepID=A0A7I8VK25_9ANNE|nr:DgyrCDS4999 [Dimorphilus gyrociliatus]
MTTSLLKGRRFFCREWAFSKLLHCLDSRPTDVECWGALITGGPGCGKSSLCAEIVWPTTSGKQRSLNKRLIAHYFCQAHDIHTLSLSYFIGCLVKQVSSCPLLPSFPDLLLENVDIEKNPDQAFQTAFIQPLNNLPHPGRPLLLLIDSIDESFLQTLPCEASENSKTIAELIAKHAHQLPDWLFLVCSARKQSRTITKLFTGFRKICLDDLRKAHVVKDVQQYILCRLDDEEQLRHHLSRETAENLNQLHIKSNGCFLYLEKVLDGVANNFIMLREIKEIPGTLNGWYSWLCQRLFAKKQFHAVEPILNVLLAARSPLTEIELYRCVCTRNIQLTAKEFSSNLQLLCKLLSDGEGGTKILFHHSFAEWLLDVKHCTQKYLCTVSDGHAMLAMSMTERSSSLSAKQIHELALHISKSGLTPTLQLYHLPLWLTLTQADIENCLNSTIPNDPLVVRLLQDAGAKLPQSSPDAMTTSVTSFATSLTDRTDTLERLLERVDDAALNIPNMNTGRTYLCSAAHDGDYKAVEVLLNKGAELDIVDRSGQNALILASRQGHVEVVKQLLNAGADVDCGDHEGWTPLRSAAWGGHMEVVEVLLNYNAAVDNADNERRTALRAAAWSGHEDIVNKLISAGADVNKADAEGRTALIAASYMAHTNIVQILLAAGAEINQADCDNRTALSVAALCMPATSGLHSDVVSLLLEKGAEVDHEDTDGLTPLLVAAHEGHAQVCELLLENDANVDHIDQSGRTALQLAGSAGHCKVVKLLLIWGAAIDTIDADGRSVLGLAALHGSTSVVKELLERGLDEMHRDNIGWNALHLACFEGHREVCELLIEWDIKLLDSCDNDGRTGLTLGSQEGHTNVVRSLIGLGADIEFRAHDGRTPLRAAALNGHIEVVELLLSHGADLNYTDLDGRSTLYLLALENQVTMLKHFLSRGANLEIGDCEGRTALHVACWQGHLDIVTTLLSHGAMPDCTDLDGRTPLQSAAWQGHAAVVCALLDHGAEVDRTCSQGATALCISSQEGHEDVVRVLLQHRANAQHADQYGKQTLKINHCSLCNL